MKAEFLKMEKVTAGKSIRVKFHYSVVYRGHVVPFEIQSNYKPLSEKEKRTSQRIGADFASCMNSLWFPHDPRHIRSAHLEGIKKIVLRITFHEGDERASEWPCTLEDNYFFDYDLGLFAMVKNGRPMFEVDIKFER